MVVAVAVAVAGLSPFFEGFYLKRGFWAVPSILTDPGGEVVGFKTLGYRRF